MSETKLEFYPFHPSDEKTHRIETTKMPLLEQTNPFEVKPLLEEFKSDLTYCLNQYEEKRFKVEGIVLYVGPDVHHKPSLQLSNDINGECCALTIFPNQDFYKEVAVGDHVIVEANYLVLSNSFGIVMKNSELVQVLK